jgi:putative membrane protein
MKKILTAAGLIAAVSGPLAATAADGKSTARVSALDAASLESAIQGDRFEIEGGKRAASSGNAAVRALGARLVKDHTKSLGEASRLARRLGVDVPEAPTPPERWELRIVGSLEGATFDRWYSDLEVADHLQDISEARDEVSHGTNPAVRAMARHELPTLRAHLAMAKAALKS